jgi:hypothetical protein
MFARASLDKEEEGGGGGEGECVVMHAFSRAHSYFANVHAHDERINQRMCIPHTFVSVSASASAAASSASNASSSMYWSTSQDR